MSNIDSFSDNDNFIISCEEKTIEPKKLLNNNNRCEVYDNNKFVIDDKLKQYRKKYYNHKKQTGYYKDYYKIYYHERLKGSRVYSLDKKEQLKQYYINNKDHILQKANSYYYKNKEMILKKRRERYHRTKVLKKNIILVN